METKEKTVWIDTDNRILACQPLKNGNRITEAESLFWDFRMRTDECRIPNHVKE